MKTNTSVQDDETTTMIPCRQRQLAIGQGTMRELIRSADLKLNIPACSRSVLRHKSPYKNLQIKIIKISRLCDSLVILNALLMQTNSFRIQTY